MSSPHRKYGLSWSTSDDWLIEKAMLKRHDEGHKDAGFVSRYHHYHEAISALMPWFQWHRWSERLIKAFTEHDEVMILGPASSGKTYTAAVYAYTTWQIWHETAITFSTTDLSSLERRSFGALKQIHRRVKELRPQIDGRFIDSKRVFTDIREDQDYGLGVDIRHGIMGVASRQGNDTEGLKRLVGLKAPRVLCISDELSLMPENFLDPVANLRKNQWFQLIGCGNPVKREDLLCRSAEPEFGWDSLGEEPKTQQWKTRFTERIGIQLCGLDTPNGDFEKGLNPYKGLITLEDIDRDRQDYGEKSIQFQMMNLGVVPKVGISSSIITVPMCEQTGAFSEPIWQDRLKCKDVIGIDAAYTAYHGDRTSVVHLRFGPDVNGRQQIAVISRWLVNLQNSEVSVEDQIATNVRDYCMSMSIPPENVGLDSTGKGTLVGAFGRLWSVAIQPIEFGGSPDERPIHAGARQLESEAYLNKVTALWYASRRIIEASQMRNLPRDFVQEASAREVKIISKTKVQIEPKDAYKKRMKISPDLWDSLCVGIEVARKAGFEIAGVGAQVGPVRNDSFKWAHEMRDKYRSREAKKMLLHSGESQSGIDMGQILSQR